MEIVQLTQAEGQRQFLGLGLLRVEKDLGRGHPQRRDEVEGVDEGDVVVLADLLPVGVQVDELVVGLVLQLGGELQSLTNLLVHLKKAIGNTCALTFYEVKYTRCSPSSRARQSRWS